MLESSAVEPQLVDLFRDGSRIPMIAVSKYSAGGRISHGTADHASLVKFIERNWGLPPITGRSRDNLPNPVQRSGNPYVPVNAPAIGDLFDLFNFRGDSDDQDHEHEHGNRRPRKMAGTAAVWAGGLSNRALRAVALCEQ